MLNYKRVCSAPCELEGLGTCFGMAPGSAVVGTQRGRGAVEHVARRGRGNAGGNTGKTMEKPGEKVGKSWGNSQKIDVSEV